MFPKLISGCDGFSTSILGFSSGALHFFFLCFSSCALASLFAFLMYGFNKRQCCIFVSGQYFRNFPVILSHWDTIVCGSNYQYQNLKLNYHASVNFSIVFYPLPLSSRTNVDDQNLVFAFLTPFYVSTGSFVNATSFFFF